MGGALAVTRFTIEHVDGKVGVMDNTKKLFARFDWGPSLVPAHERATTACVRLISGADTTTGYVWEKP